jgi:hypothetical protein
VFASLFRLARQFNQKLRMILPTDSGAFACPTRYTTALPQREVSSRTAPLSLPREFLRSYLAWGCAAKGRCASDFRRADQSSYVQHTQCRETQGHQHSDGWQAPTRPPSGGHTERDDYFRTSASLAASISVRANHWPRSVSRAEPCRRFVNTENIPSRARSATVTPEMCLPSGVPHQ